MLGVYFGIILIEWKVISPGLSILWWPYTRKENGKRLLKGQFNQPLNFSSP